MFSTRTEMLLGEEGIKRLAKARVAVFGIGGVGGFTCEALARAGVGMLDLFDDDIVAVSNINRQIVALESTVGQAKVEVMRQRIREINPACVVNAYKTFYTPENAEEFPFECYDYIVDAVDTVSAKLTIVERAKNAGVPVICAMGAGNKLHPELFEVADIEKTSVCPLARVMRRELRKRRIKGVKVVYSKEMPLVPMAVDAPVEKASDLRTGNPKKQTPGSISFVPGAAGLLLAGAVVRDLLGIE